MFLSHARTGRRRRIFLAPRRCCGGGELYVLGMCGGCTSVKMQNQRVRHKLFIAVQMFGRGRRFQQHTHTCVCPLRRERHDECIDPQSVLCENVFQSLSFAHAKIIYALIIDGRHCVCAAHIRVFWCTCFCRQRTFLLCSEARERFGRGSFCFFFPPHSSHRSAAN